MTQELSTNYIEFLNLELQLSFKFHLVLQVVVHLFESDEHASTDRAMNLKLYGHPDHVRRYGEEDFLNKLKSSGFYVLIDNFASTFTELELEKFGIDKHERLFVCSKGYELT